jgi:hypothetical protein
MRAVPASHLSDALPVVRRQPGDVKGRSQALERVRKTMVSRNERESRTGVGAPLYARPRTPPFLKREHAWKEARVPGQPIGFGGA